MKRAAQSYTLFLPCRKDAVVRKDRCGRCEYLGVDETTKGSEDCNEKEKISG